MLQVHDLNVFYGDIQALWDVSFELRNGEVVTALGPNGAGKTTLMKTISGLHRPSGGSITFDGQPIKSLPPYRIVELGLVQVAEARQLFPILAERRNQLAGTLSGGQQLVVAIGRALMSRPRLLMLDEPSLGLAPLVVADMFRAIRRIHEQGIAVLLVEQNVHQALAVADRAYCLETGRVVREGTPDELLADPHVRAAYLGV